MDNIIDQIRASVTEEANRQIIDMLRYKISIANSEKNIVENELYNNLMILEQQNVSKLSNGDIVIYDPKHALSITSQHLIKNFSSACYIELVESYNANGLFNGKISIHYPDSDSNSELFNIAVQTYINNVIQFAFDSVFSNDGGI